MLLAVQDNDPGCQRHLAQPLPWHAEHVLDDMTALIDHRLDPLELHPDNLDYGVISQKIWSSGLTLQIWCASCGDFHAQSDLVADWEWDSTPCTMWSSSGREKHLADPANFVWICTTRRHHLTATPAIMYENVTKQPAWFVAKDHPSRLMFRLERAPRHVGFKFTNRLRALTFMPHTDKVQVRRDPAALFDAVSALLQARDLTRPGMLFEQSEIEFLVEAQMLCQRRFEQELPCHIIAQVLQEGLNAVDFTFLLNAREVCSLNDFVERYRNMTGMDAFQNPDLVVFVGDNGSTHLSWSAVPNALPTTRMNTGLLWAPYWRRWVSSRKLLTSLGIPQTQRHLASLGFMSPSEVANFQFENLLPRARKKWAGNCVHAALAGVFLACMLSSVRLNHRN